MRTLSTGHPSTLGSYLLLCRAVFGPNSAQAKFIQKKIEESPGGTEEESIADERQMLLLLRTLI